MKRILVALLACLLSSVDLSLAAWDRNFIAVNYKGFPQSIAEIDSDLALLGPHFGYIRTYNSLFGAASPENAVAGRVAAYNLAHPSTPIKVALGVALTPGNLTASQSELDQAIANAKAYTSAVNAVVVGNENLGNFTEAQLIGYINYAKAKLSGTGVAVTTCQTWGVLAGHPDLVNACSSYALANIYPYWDGPGYQGGTAAKAGADTLKNWQSRFLSDYNQLVAKYGVGKIRIGETGWPSAGSQVSMNGHYTGIPSQTSALPNEQTYIEQYAAWASAHKLFTYLFSSFDEPEKVEPGGVGPHWGLYTTTSRAKWTLGQLPAVNAGTTLWLGTDSPYGDLAFLGGTLQIIDPQTSWPNGFDITADTTSTLDNAGNSLTHTGTVSGRGNLIHTGVGTTSHQGDGSGFSGTYTVAAGTLNLSSTLGTVGVGCTVVVNPGAALGGTGPLIGSLTNRGLVNPGASPGTLNVVGSYTQMAGATFVVEIAAPDNYDRISVTGVPGTASLAGAISPTLLAGFKPARNQVFPGVITATGGLTGTFDTLTSQQLTPILFWQPRYLPTSFDLAAWPDFANPGLPLTSNQSKVGLMLNVINSSATGDLAGMLDTIAQLPTRSAVANAFQQLSPDLAGALPALSLAGAMMQWRSLSNRLSYQRWRQGSPPSLTGRGFGSFNLSYSRPEGLMLAYNGADLGGLVSGASSAPQDSGLWGLYADFVATLGSRDSSANQTGYNFDIFGFTCGADYRLRDDLLLGVGSGYYHTSASYQNSAGAAQVNSIPFYTYAAYIPGNFYAMGSVGYTLNLYGLNRNLTFGNRTANGSANGSQVNAAVETGYDLKLQKIILTPAATLFYTRAWVPSFTETGADSLNLHVNSQNADSLQSGLGARLSCPFKIKEALMLPQVSAFYQHEFANHSRGLDARLAQAGSTFNFTTDSPQRDFAILGAGVAVSLNKNLTVQANYNVELGRGNYTPHFISAGFRWQF
jgi:outer membrane autotransporter protein